MSNLEKFSDEQLMARLGTGDMSCLGELAQRHHEKAASLAYRMMGTWETAEDISQEAFLRVFHAAKKYKPKAKFTTWLYRIVVNLCIDAQRKNAKSTVSLENIKTELAWSEDGNRAEKAETTVLVQKAISTLNERQRMVVILHRYDGMSHGEISEVTGWSKSAVESLLVRAYANLRVKLQNMRDFL